MIILAKGSGCENFLVLNLHYHSNCLHCGSLLRMETRGHLQCSENYSI